MIVPRWEWRTFGDRFGAVDRRFDELTAEAVRETDEVYVLSRLTDSSVKLRDQLIDVKVLRDGCMAERSEIRTEHGTRQTIGIESEDPGLVRAVVAGLGFNLPANVSLPCELKRLAGFEAPVSPAS
jgi:hypothetical protein